MVAVLIYLHYLGVGTNFYCPKTHSTVEEVVAVSDEM